MSILIHLYVLFLFVFKKRKRRITSVELMSGQVLLFCHCWSSSSSSSISSSWLSSDHKGAKSHFNENVLLVKTHCESQWHHSHALFVCRHHAWLAPSLTLMWANEIFRLSEAGWHHCAPAVIGYCMKTHTPAFRHKFHSLLIVSCSSSLYCVTLGGNCLLCIFLYLHESMHNLCWSSWSG